MKQKKIPIRSCIITREKLEKKDLIRIVVTKDGIVSVDSSGKLNGRGYYVKKDFELIQKIKNNKILDKILKIEIQKEVIEDLERVVSAHDEC